MQVLRDWLRLTIELPTDLENRRVILNLLKPDKSAKLLDLGCRDGIFTLELGKRVGTEQLYGVDVVPDFIEQSEAKGIRAYQADLNEPLPLDSDSFDIVHANQVLEHIYHTDLFLKEIYRVLKPGGYAVISTPNLAGWHSIASLFLGWQPFPAEISDEIRAGNPLVSQKRRSGYTHPRHHRVPTYRGLKELFQYHGFRVEKIVGIGYHPFPVKIGRVLSRLDPRHSVCLTIKARKA